MPRPWGGDDEDGDAGADGDADDSPFPTLDLPWPDGDVSDVPWTAQDQDADDDDAECQLRPVHRRRSRHSFEPHDLSDSELDCLLRGPSSDRLRVPDGTARPWPAWAKLVVTAAVLLVVLGILGVINAAAGDNPDTITTRGQSRHPVTTQPARTRPPARSSGATALPERTTSGAAPACHPSYDPCVPVAPDVDCAIGQGNGPAYLDHTVEVTGPDVYALDADHDRQACE